MTATVFGKALEKTRLAAGPSGKKLSRSDFGALLDLTPTQVRNIEQGRQPRPSEYEKIITRFPELHEIDTAALAEAPAEGTMSPQKQRHPNAGMHCIQCNAQYRDDGMVKHKSSCPDALPAPAPASPPASPPPSPYCTCGARTGFTRVDGTDSWVCASCRKPSRTVHEAAQSWHGDLQALGEDELENELDIELASDFTSPQVEEASAVKPYSSDGRTELPVIYISNSYLQSFKRCRRKWWLGWYRGLELKSRDPVGALAIGNRVHRALQAWYVPEGETPVDPREALERAISADWQACVQAYGKQQVDQLPPDLVREFGESVVLERAMIAGYVQWLENTGVDSGLRVIAPETYLEAPLEVPGADRDVRIIGKIDARTYRDIDGVRHLLEHKTVGSLTEPLKTIRIQEQPLHYLLLEYLQDVDGGRCDGTLYNMLRKVKRTSRAMPPFYDRVEVRHNAHELEAFKKRLTGTIREVLEVCARLDKGEDPLVVVYPTPNKNCSWDCDFLPVCPMFDDGSRVEAMLEQHYAQGNPYSYYGTKEE